MTLALVQAVVGIILLMIATGTGLMISVAFLLPQQTEKSAKLMETAPWKCFWSGIGMMIPLLAGFLMVNGIPIAKPIGLGLLMFVGALMAIGSAGIAQTIGRRGESDSELVRFGMMLRGSVVYSLALGFPFIGWFVFAPLALVFAMGAGIQAIVPERRSAIVPPAVPPSNYDITNRPGLF